MAHKLTTEEKRRLVRDYTDGYTLRVLGEKYGISKSTILRYLAEYETPMRSDWRRKRKSGRVAKNPRKLRPCGTDAAYSRHLFNKEIPCDPCTEAHAAAVKRRRNARKANASGV